MICHSRLCLRRPNVLHLLLLCPLVLCPPAVAQSNGIYRQDGIDHEVFRDSTHLVLRTDGRVDPLMLALELASRGLASTLAPIGDSNTAFEAAVGQVTPALISQIEQVAGITHVHQVVRFRSGGQAFGVTSEITVKFGPTVSSAERLAFAEEYDLDLDGPATAALGLPGIAVYRVPDGDALDRAEVVFADPRLTGWKSQATLVSPVKYTQVNPQDEFYGLQWHLRNTGQRGGTVDSDIDVIPAWEETLGAGIRISMLDDGCQFDHQDLTSRYLGFSQNTLGSGDVDPGFLGHGTSVMGLMVAAANSIGVRGVAPESRFTASGPLTGAPSVDAAAFNHALANGVDVHNNSWRYAIGSVPNVLREAIENAANTGRNGNGMVIVFAAGNEAQQLAVGDSFCTLPETLQVGGTGQTDIIAAYSNYGVTQDVMGPTAGNDGVGLATTDNLGDDGFNDGDSFFDISDGDYTQNFNGTSAAAPVVAGVVALVLSENPNLNREQVRQIINHSADRVAPNDADYDRATTFSLRYGHGRVNAGAAVEAAQRSAGFGQTWPAPPADIRVTISENDGNLMARVSWEPGGFGTGENHETDEEGVLVVYRLRAREGPEGIQFAPEDGEAYVTCDPNQADTCPILDFEALNVAAVFSGVAEQVEDEGTTDQVLRRFVEFPVAGNAPADPQDFAIFAFNSQVEYSFGVSFNQDGDIVGPGREDGGPVVIPPPDMGRPIDPELNPLEPGKTEPPSVTATADRLVCTAPCTVEFHGGAVTPNQIIDRGWSFGDGNSADQDAAVHTYQLPNTYNAVYFAVDDNEPIGRTASKMLTVEVRSSSTGGGSAPGARSAAIDVLTSGPLTAPNARVRFAANTEGIGTSSTTLRVTYSWDFGDGNTGSGQTTENVFANPGFYSVVVQVIEEFTTGPTVITQASTIVQIGGTSNNPGSASTSSTADSQVQQDQNQAADGEACGMTALGMIAFLGLGLIGLSRTRRRRCGCCRPSPGPASTGSQHPGS